MSKIRFEAKLSKIESWTILRLPVSVSAKLPSRGMVIVAGTLNNNHFQAALEPDGKGSHWFKLDQATLMAANAAPGDRVTLAIEPSANWPEPQVPADLKAALKAAPQVNALWMDITTLARWDWIRWISSTKNPATRKKRIEVAVSKLSAGSRRPCCFNRAMCTDPMVSKNGVLLEPAKT